MGSLEACHNAALSRAILYVWIIFTTVYQLLVSYCLTTLIALVPYILIKKCNLIEVMEVKLRKGESCQICRWWGYGRQVKDKKTVMFISTEFENQMATFALTRKSGKGVQKPLPIIQYNAFIKGVDRADQFLPYYPCERKTLQW